jgi:hypothetical protein
MVMLLRVAGCVSGVATKPRRLGAGETIVIVVVISLSVAMAVFGAPEVDTLKRLGGAGLVAVLLLRLWSAAPVRAVKTALRTIACTAPQV